MKISKGTLVRTVLTFVIVANMLLSAVGIDIIDVSESAVAAAIENIVSILAIVASWWYNNSFTKNAKIADEVMNALNDGKEVDVSEIVKRDK